MAKISGDETKVDMLMYCMGSQVEDIILTFGLSTQELRVYKTVQEKFDKHFIVRRNVIFERARFNRLVQQDGETIKSFVTDLYALIENCEYGELSDDFLRDRIVVGIKDMKLSESLQMDDKLTLRSTLEKVRSKELIQKQSTLLQDMTISRADAVTRAQKAQKHTRPQEKPKYSKKKKTCHRCGNQPHKLAECPARESTCSKCSMVGHWQKYCRNKRLGIREVEATNGDNDENVFLGEVTVAQVRDSDWDITLLINNKPLTFKIDCGADVTVVSKADYEKVASDSTLLKTDKVLLGANQQPLNVIGVL